MKDKSFYADLAVYIILIAVLLVQTSCGKAESSQADDKKERSFFAMDTYITLTAYGDDDTDKVLQSAESEINELEKLWSVTDENSDIYKLNESGSANVDDRTADLISFALDMNKRTDGAFDITLYPVLKAWGFTTGEYRVPADDEIARLLENTGSDKVKLNGNAVQIAENIQIDLGAVGKGRAGDIAAKKLKDSGVTSALLDLGGNIQTVGMKPDGGKWKVGIQSPFGEGSFATLSIGECAVVTSGGYERYFVQDGKTYWHIIDPKTGKPADSGIASVTVVGNDGGLCDALSTSLFVMGLDGAEKLWRESDDFEMIIVTSDGEIYATEGLENDIEINSDLTDEKVSVIRR